MNDIDRLEQKIEDVEHIFLVVMKDLNERMNRIEDMERERHENPDDIEKFIQEL